MTTPICLYHIADLDGKCSAAIVRRAVPFIKLIGWDYGWPIPWEQLKGKHVYVVDLSLQIGDMKRLIAEANLVCWYDHHKTSLDLEKELLQTGVKVFGERKNGVAACEITWEAFYPTTPIPQGVYLLGRYDVWDDANPLWNKSILPFQYGMRVRDEDVSNRILWDLVLTPHDYDYDSFLSQTIREGRLILDYEAKQNALYARVCSFEATLPDGTRLLAINRGLANSRLFDAVWDPTRYEAMAAFYLQRRGTWKVSLYTTRDDVDVSAIAKRYGGGGHKKAAGFLTASLPWTRVKGSQPAQELPKEAG